MLDSITVGFIGFGNMAQAMANGFLYRNALPPSHIFACAQNWEKLCRNTKPKGIQPCADAAQVVQNASVIIVAVKPYLVPEVLAPIKDALQGKILVSVAVGLPFDAYEAILPPGVHHLSIMPNTPVSTGEGVIICENRHSLTKDEQHQVETLFSQIGMVQYVATKQLGIAGTLCGCGPAFVSVFLESLADAAVLHGLPRDMAYRLASQMMIGTGKLHLQTGSHPGQMKDAVCSPGGTTIKGVAMLERKGLRSAVIDAIDAIENR